MIKEGTIVIRTGNYNNSSLNIKFHEGHIFKTIRDGKDKFAHYLTGAISPNNYRLATPSEIQFFENGGKNIKGMQNNSIEALINNGFSVNVDRNTQNFRKYLKLCKEFKVKYSTWWAGSRKYYGFNNNCEKVSESSFGEYKFPTVEMFETYLKKINNNNNLKPKESNEVLRKNSENTRNVHQGRARVSKCSKQITNGVRYTGNKKGSTIQRTAVRRTEISQTARQW